MFRVLVVDDEIYSVKGIVDGIDWKRLGVLEVFEAYNAREAKAVLESTPIDLMISDINMPEENGLELVEWAKLNNPEVEVIFLTCHADFNYARKALQLGSSDYLLKPVIYKEMEEVLWNNFQRLLIEKSNLENMASYSYYYSIEERWKALLESGDRQGSSDLIDQSLEWIANRRDRKASLIKVYQSILLIAEYLLKKKGINTHDIDWLELNEETHESTFSEEKLKQWMEYIVSIVCTNSATDENKLPPNSIVNDLQNYIKQNLSKRLTREELAKYVHLNESYLSRLFHKETGLSLSDYILQERMKKAGELIAETDEPIYEIANQLCYDNFSYFSKMFKRVFYITPQEYRKKYYTPFARAK